MLRLVRTINILTLSLLLVYEPVAFAVEVELTKNYGIGMLNRVNNKARKENAVLRRGTVVDIPDSFRVNDSSGRFNPELTLNNWLRNAGRTADPSDGITFKTSQVKDFYYPITIKSLAPGSVVPTYKGQVYFLALRTLTRNEQGEMRVNQDTVAKPAIDSDRETRSAGLPTPRQRPTELTKPQVAGPRQVQPQARRQETKGHETKTEAQIGCQDGSCAPTAAAPFQELISTLGPVLREAAAKKRETINRTSDDFDKLSNTFRASCGFRLDDFVDEVEKRASESGIPSDILLSILVQESSGRCNARAGNRNGTVDSGLFGLNSQTARMRHCTRNEMNRMRSSSVEGLESGPMCRENPVVNLDLSIKTLKAKASDLEDSSIFRGRRFNGFNMNHFRDSNGRMNRDGWRLAVSAYNSGAAWVLQAKYDLEVFNQRNGTKLNPYKWEDLRVFYLRNALSGNNEQRYFGSVLQHARAKRFAIANLAYTENIVPRYATPAGQEKTIAELWRSENP